VCVCDKKNGIVCAWHGAHGSDAETCNSCGGIGSITIKLAGEYAYEICPDCHGDKVKKLEV